MIKVGIVGATAYTSLELIRLLVKHSGVEIVYLGVRKEGKPKISEIFPSLQKILELCCTGMNPEEMPEGTDLVFITLPPTIAMQYVPKFLQAGVKVIDFSADYRFRDKSVYEKWYKASHTDTANLKDAVYGIPELFRNKIKSARLVSNPGCYPTSAILGLAPLILKNLIHLDDIIIDAKSGVSGRGREPREDTHYCECNENVEAYNVGVHRHAPEIEQLLSLVARTNLFVRDTNVSICFVPHLVPMNRGILSTIYAMLKSQESGVRSQESVIRDEFAEFYRNEPFVRIKNELPKTKDVVNTNFCDIAVRVVGNRVIIISCIDNLIKGASGQAVQNMNVMCGLEETLPF